jgi:hypothetical protein
LSGPSPRPSPKGEGGGADLVIPALALAFAAYFFVSIRDLAWEAKANGVIIGTALTFLCVVQVIRVVARIVRGEGTWSLAPLWAPREALGKRLGLVAVTIVFIAALPWLGLTLGLLLGMLVALWLMGVRRKKVLVGISVAVAASAYLLFIAALDANFPHGPVEKAVDVVRGKSA